MKTDLWKKLILAVVGGVVVLGMIGCEDDEDDGPENIAGTWAIAISGTDSEGPYSYNETMNIVQNGSDITGNYTYNNETYTISGTYENGRMVVRDSDGWTLSISFDNANSGAGQSTGVYDSGTPGTETLTLTR